LVAPFNDLDAVRKLFEEYPDDIAGAIVEPIAANMGFVMPQGDYLHELAEICHEHGALFILDEVMTGFRVSVGGAQKAFDLYPDITCLGKVIGGGLPVGAYAGKREIMQHVAPAGNMYQAGTLSGNPLAMTAGLMTIRVLKHEDNFAKIASQTQKLADGMRAISEKLGIPMQVGNAGTMFGFYFLKEDGAIITDFASAKQYADTAFYAKFYHAMLDKGIYLAPSQFEAGFVSLAHTDAHIDKTLAAAEDVLRALTS
jgi:glutamate-1-semialdehyde 2,1-aminomutase